MKALLPALLVFLLVSAPALAQERTPDEAASNQVIEEGVTLSTTLQGAPLLDVDDASGTTRLRLNEDGGFVVTGEQGVGLLPAEGPGTRLMWSPQQGAFRAGRVSGIQWDELNIGQGSVAIGVDVRASGDYSAAFGLGSTAAGFSTFAAGENSIATGAASVALGYGANTNVRQGSFVFADRSSVDEFRAGVNHSANWRVSGGFRIFTSSNLTTGVTIQSGVSVSNWGQSSAVISTSTGAWLSTSGTWHNASDVNGKHLFEYVSGEDVLRRLREVPIRTWSYQVDGDKVRHMGPTAQDFRAAFGLGASDVSIATVDADGVALAAAQALEARTRDQEARIEALEAENLQLRQRLAALEAAVGVFTQAR